jgi:HD-like signal output (HDOD) protein/prolyl-tRNA editing enzyme YbaK/EbsC (Cys-tRNA(Pro) deacylase)
METLMDNKELNNMIPAVVNKVFEQYQNTAELNLSESDQPVMVDRAGVPDSQILKTILMADTLGRTQLIFLADSMLDVDALNTKVGRAFEALPHEDVNSLVESYSLKTLPAIPDITGLPAVVDSRVLEQETVYVETDQADKLIRLSKGAFSASTQKAKIENIAVPLSAIAYNINQPGNDLAQINQALEKFTSLRIKQRLEDTLELPPLPASAQEIIRLRSNPDAGADELADIIEKDPSLAAQVVSWASSSFYNAPGKIKSVHDAIIRVLGFDMVMNLAMGLALGRTLKVPQDEPKGYAPYWQQAMWLALGTTSVISKIDPTYRPSFGLSYLSGLLHNFGYLVLAHVFPPHFSLMCRYIEANPHLDTGYIEHFLLGITREQIGSQLMSVWNMPEEVIIGLRHQKNQAFEGVNSEYAALLQLTQHLLANAGVIPKMATELDESVYARLHITEEKANDAIEQLLESKDDVAAVANLMGR